MPERTRYAHGVPSWVDLASADVGKSIAFYSGLFGWEHASAGLPGENEPGTLGWNELQARSKDAALPFYESVFGHEPEEMPGAMGEYTVLKVGGEIVAGLVEMNEMWPKGVPPHWHVYFVVADADGAAEQIKALGGSVHVDPFDVEGTGRMSVVSDSNGTHFSIVQLANPGV